MIFRMRGKNDCFSSIDVHMHVHGGKFPSNVHYFSKNDMYTCTSIYIYSSQIKILHVFHWVNIDWYLVKGDKCCVMSSKTKVLNTIKAR